MFSIIFGLPFVLAFSVWKLFNYINYELNGAPMLALFTVGFYGYYKRRRNEVRHNILQREDLVQEYTGVRTNNATARRSAGNDVFT